MSSGPSTLAVYMHVLILLCATVILEKTIRIPSSLSIKAAQVLKGFLNKVRTQLHIRLGFVSWLVSRLIGA